MGGDDDVLFGELGVGAGEDGEDVRGGVGALGEVEFDFEPGGDVEGGERLFCAPGGENGVRILACAGQHGCEGFVADAHAEERRAS